MAPATKAELQARVHSALLLALTSDALGMPAHWFYTPSDIPAFFPPSGITKMEAAPATHPHDFMKLPEKEAEEGKRIIGDVILKGKRQAWGVTNGHIHAGLPAGANTLNADVLRLTTRWLAGRKGEYSKDGFLAEYVKFLTSSEPLYADPYAESYHRAFFTNLQEGKKLDECGSPSHYIGGFAVTIAVITPVLLKTGDVARAQAVAAEHLALTHQGEELSAALTEYVALVARLLMRGEGESAAEIINEFAAIRLDAKVPNWRSLAQDRTPGLSVDAEVVGKAFGLSCMINDAWASVLYLAAKYHNDVATGLLANVNLGGENVHRGLVLGVLLGLANGRVEEPFSKQLQHADAINAEIGAYVRAVVAAE